MKLFTLLAATLFSVSLFANEALESQLKSIDEQLSNRSFSELVANCKTKLEFSKMDLATRQTSQFTASHKDCTDQSVKMIVKRTSGSYGPKKGETTLTKETYTKFKGNPLRELLHEMTNTPTNGQTLSMDKISVYEVKTVTVSLLTKNGYQDFNAIQVWLDVEKADGETEQLHVTVGNDGRLPFGARLLEVFYDTTALIHVSTVL